MWYNIIVYEPNAQTKSAGGVKSSGTPKTRKRPPRSLIGWASQELCNTLDSLRNPNEGISSESSAQIFLSYAREDEEKVKNLYPKVCVISSGWTCLKRVVGHG